MIIKRKLFSYYSDGPETIKLKELELRKTKPSFLAKLLSKLIKSVRNNIDNSLFYNIYEGNKRIGEIELFRESNKEVNVVWIGINQEFRGKKYAQTILEYFIDYTRGLGYKEMTLEVPEISPDARHIYSKFGFKETGKLTGSEDVVWGGLTAMKKIL